MASRSIVLVLLVNRRKLGLLVVDCETESENIGHPVGEPFQDNDSGCLYLVFGFNSKKNLIRFIPSQTMAIPKDGTAFCFTTGYLVNWLTNLF
jgi:hypothetical protein